MQLLQGVHLHVAAGGAGAAVGGAGDESFVRGLAAEAVEHAFFCGDDEIFGLGGFGVVHHFFGGANDVGEHSDAKGAFGVCDEFGVGIFFADFGDTVPGELDVNVTGTLPKIHFSAGLLHDPTAEVLIGNEEDVAVGRSGLHDGFRIAAGANDIAQGFDVGAAVDVGDDVVIFVGVVGEELFQLIAGTSLLKRASGVLIRENDDFVRICNFGRLRHEVDAAKCDDIGVGFFCLKGKPQRVANVVSDLLDFGDLVVVGEDDGVALFLKAQDFLTEVNGFGDGGGHALIGGKKSAWSRGDLCRS